MNEHGSDDEAELALVRALLDPEVVGWDRALSNLEKIERGRKILHIYRTCPRCGLTSYNPNDVVEGYCGNCHDWTGNDRRR